MNKMEGSVKEINKVGRPQQVNNYMVYTALTFTFYISWHVWSRGIIQDFHG